MIDAFLEPFASSFAQRGLMAGVLVAVMCSTVGVWVVLRSLAFMGDALAHGVIPGIAVASLLGYDLTLGAAVAAMLTIGGVSLVTNRAGLPEDTGTGLLFAGMLSLGVAIISRSGTFAVDATRFLFGDVLGVTGADIRLQAIATLVAVVISVMGYRAFITLAFDERKAQLLGLRPRLARAALLGLIGLTVVTSFRTVGSLLVFGLLVAPAATATLVVRRVPAIMVTSMVLGVLAVVIGLQLSYHLDVAGSAAMSGTSVALFFLIFAVRSVSRSVASPRLA